MVEDKVYDTTPAIPPALRALTGRRLLDVGCGTGNLEAMTALSFEPAAFNISFDVLGGTRCQRP